MRMEAYHTRSPQQGIPVKPPDKQHKKFARALSAAVARRMRMEGLDCLYALYKRIPEWVGIPPQTVYSCLYVTNRPSVWVMHNIAAALGTTMDTLIQEAMSLLASGQKFQTAGEVFRGEKPQGRKRGPRFGR